MFERLDEAAFSPGDAMITVSIDDHQVRCRRGDTVIAALLTSGEPVCRQTVVNEVPRGPYCMMGICYDCLVTIDGQSNQQGCMTLVREGMKIERQQSLHKARP